ncbi:uncharacterized protein EDB93DRAFT_1101289 [Suillus bovinus]|uniref:uncharacterized protein n=1 Tax=Suillus bovinus TaxID=48563 RepID=UPI001B877494|nr:uncharacterized protein EDB93DRAFT_1101289 [Suillus bovinus]KAG2156873.1 hypothetical protein EDB93DRAFT_1101289 [Suillus bovinus]
MQSSAMRPSSSVAPVPTIQRPPVQAGSTPSSSARPSSGQVTQPTAPIPRQPAADPLLQAQGHPPAQPVDEIAALRARIAELERGNAHGTHTSARAPTPQQALISDPAAIDCIRAGLASTKEDSKRLTLPALQPGHKVSALNLPVLSKVEEAFKQYQYVPYTMLTHTAQSKANLRGEDSSYIGAAKAAEEKTLHYWGEDRASTLASHHLVVLDIGRTYTVQISPRQP